MSTKHNENFVTVAEERQATIPAFEVVHSALSDQPISVDVAIEAVESRTSGAVVSFSGVVRNHDGGKAVERLSYTAHPRAQQVLANVSEAVAAEFMPTDAAEEGVPLRIWAAHRVGDLQIGDAALVCAVAAGHREQAFAVCSTLVDRIKAEVPIWKEQFFADGTVEWVGVAARS